MDYKGNKHLVPLARNLRKNMTKEERRLWYEFLRQYPVRFARQKVLGQYIADFYCAEAKLVVELDGSQHYDPSKQENDRKRTEYLSGYDILVLRIPNNEVMRNLSGVCDYIHQIVQKRISSKRSPSRP